MSLKMPSISIIVRFGALVLFTLPAVVDSSGGRALPCSVFHQEAPYDCRPVADFFLDRQDGAKSGARSDPRVLEDAFNALAVLQNSYFAPVNGTWPASIDWTGAVVETIISGMLITMTKSLYAAEKRPDWNEKENLLSTVFSQITLSFFGQNAAAILGQAYDDVLWVVLGWLEAIKFVHLHSSLHHSEREQKCLNVPTNLDAAVSTISWHGNNWVCTFAQRARAFWDFATKGWDTTLCHGGMVWNPRLTPYKNAITNELWISASISMYENFPNDKFNGSWVVSKGFPTNDPVYLAAAIVGYKWLKDVNMTNSQGLYVDGYHVDMSKPSNVECDQRDEMVYTYNQGVILTGQRGLFTVTGSPSYLEEGHNLIQNVINATGWDVRRNAPIDNIKEPRQGQLPPWRGIGRYGILEERCDASGSCSQDSQTFKGIFFHHLTAFCAPIDPVSMPTGAELNQNKFDEVQASHDKACQAYIVWVKHNVDAALDTRDATGRFGMWWGAGIFHNVNVTARNDGIDHIAPNITDYRNEGTPLDATWGLNVTWQPGSRSSVNVCRDLLRPDPNLRASVSAESGDTSQMALGQLEARSGDPNDRGRGRTVETQAGGLALLRTYWELSQS